MVATAHGWLSVIACVGLLMLVVVVSGRGRRTSLEIPLLLLCLDDFVWNFSDFAFDATGTPAFHWLDVSFSPFGPPLALHVVASFVGKARAARTALIVAYAAAAGLSLSAWLAFWWPFFSAWTFSWGWSAAFAASYVPCLIFALALLVSQLSQLAPGKERTGTVAVLIALMGRALLTSTEFIDDFEPKIVPIGNVGTLFSMCILAAAVLKLDLVDLRKRQSRRWCLLALVASSVVVALLVQLVRVAPANAVEAVLIFVVSALAASGWMPELMRRDRFRRETELRLVSVGNLADQMAHDLRTPLAALKAGLQFVQEEHRRGSHGEKVANLLDLMLEQVERLNRTIASSRQIDEVVPERSSVRVNDVIGAILALHSAGGGAPTIVSQFEADLPLCKLDRELFTRALENLLSNALESMPEGGHILVRTSQRVRGWRARQVVVEVEDTGIGIDPRRLNRIFGALRSDKLGGSGRGLHFVRRVVEAHGGRASVDSRIGGGTSVRLELPAE